MQRPQLTEKGLNYLVLATRFNESPESLPAYLLCTKLAKEGHHVSVTTTSTDEDSKVEFQRAKQLTEEHKGTIQLIKPQHRWFEKPSAEWIQNIHKQYFGSLSQLNVNGIVGTLPGTVQTAVELKETLGCQVILLATCKLGAGDHLQRDIVDLVRLVDEVWSVGSDIYKHYEPLLVGKLQLQHKQIDILPDANKQQHTEIQKNDVLKVVSVWSHPIEFFHNGRKEYSKGSNSQSYYNLSTALGQCGKKIQWHIYGLQMNDQRVLAIRNHAKAHMLKVSASIPIPSINSFPWGDCQAFTVPDVTEEIFNFFALRSIWLGIPTLVSCQSSIGQFLLSYQCPEAFRAVVNLTGNSQHDARAWIDKINKELVGREANPTQWAKSMSNYFQKHAQSFSSDISFNHPLGDHRSSHDSVDSFSSATDEPMCDSTTTEKQNLMTPQQLHKDSSHYDDNSFQVKTLSSIRIIYAFSKKFF